MSDPIYLDLDAIESPVDFTIKLNGKEHKVVETSVSDFIATARALEGLALGASVEKELEVTLSIIQRTLPSVPETELRGLKLTQLHKIRDFVMTANGDKAEQTAPAAAGETASGNEPKAS
jgi:hypothetical protein